MKPNLPTRSGLSLERLASFLAIADRGGIAAAAEGDPVRQSQLSRQLKELEEFFGGSLIERRPGFFRLTNAGRELQGIARNALTRLRDLQCRCEDGAVEVHLGAGESVFAWWLLPRLGTLLDKEPKVVLTLHNLQSEEILSRLRDGRLDFGILRRAPQQAGLAGIALKPMEYALFVAQSALPKLRSPTPHVLIAKLPLALLEGPSELNQAFEDWARAEGMLPRTRLRCTSYLQAAEAVRTLGMAALLPTWAEAAFCGMDVTRIDLARFKAFRTPLQLVWSKRQAAVRGLLPRLAKVIGTSLTTDSG